WVCTAGGAAVLVTAWLTTTGRIEADPDRPRQQWPLTGTIVLAFGVFCLVTGLLLNSAGTTDSDALRTGGMAAASVVALYGLWLYDRRRRVDEDRHALDSQRKELDDQRYRLAEARQELDRQRADDDRGR